MSINHYIGIDPGVSGFASILTYNENGSRVGFAQFKLHSNSRHEFFKWLRDQKTGENMWWKKPCSKLVILHEETEKFVGNYNMKSSAGVVYGESCGFMKGALSEILLDAPRYWAIIRPKDWMAEFDMKRDRGEFHYENVPGERKLNSLSTPVRQRVVTRKAESTGEWKKRLRDKAFEIIGEVSCSIPAADSLLLAILARRRDPELC